MGTLSNQELVNLSDSLQKFEDFMAPDSSCLAPLGEAPLEKGIKKFFNPDFTAVVQRSASAYSGFPFIIEMGIAYGGDIKYKKNMFWGSPWNNLTYLCERKTQEKFPGKVLDMY